MLYSCSHSPHIVLKFHIQSSMIFTLDAWSPLLKVVIAFACGRLAGFVSFSRRAPAAVATRRPLLPAPLLTRPSSSRPRPRRRRPLCRAPPSPFAATFFL